MIDHDHFRDLRKNAVADLTGEAKESSFRYLESIIAEDHELLSVDLLSRWLCMHADRRDPTIATVGVMDEEEQAVFDQIDGLIRRSASLITTTKNLEIAPDIYETMLDIRMRNRFKDGDLKILDVGAGAGRHAFGSYVTNRGGPAEHGNVVFEYAGWGEL
jgi:hypothetical protein